MSRPTNNDRRVLGPYADGARWRLVIVEPDGKTQKKSFPTKEAAEEERARLSLAMDSVTVMDAIKSYVAHLEQKGCRPGSVKTSRFRLDSFFGLDEPTGGLAMEKLTSLTRERCQALYEGQTARFSVDTHRNTLTLAKTFAAWCVKKGWIAVNPLAEIEPIGRRKRGKEQLRIDEARTFLTTCESYAKDGDAGAIAAMTSLLLGLRASEVAERVVRDLDDDGRILWVPFSKTEAGKRTLEIPANLRPYLKRLAEGKAPTDRLFTEKDRQWVRYHAQRMCRLAKVPVVTTHSLRGLHATLAIKHGSTGHVVASALGHTSYEGVTKRHYVKPGTTEGAASRRVQSMLDRTHTDHDDTQPSV